MVKKFLIILLGLSIGLSVFADTTAPGENDFSYLFHLYYDNGQLYADRDFQFKYDILGAAYMQPTLTTQYPYRGEIINMLGEVANHFAFDPKNGDAKFTKGKISVKAPYVADGEKAVFYDLQNQPILTIFISDSSFCDDDGICNANRGEDSLSCPKDCKQALPAPPVTSPAATPASSSGILSGIIYGVVGLALLGGLWWVFKRRRSGSGPTLSYSTSQPPLTPPSPIAPLPTPPAPPGTNNPV